MSHPPSLVHLLGRLGILEQRVRTAVDRRRAADPDPNDPVRGLYVSDEQIDDLLDGTATTSGLHPPDRERLGSVEAGADGDEASGHDLRLRRLQRTFELVAVDIELLLTALAPDLDRRFEKLYGYLHDDITRRRASIGLALELAGLAPTAAIGRQRFSPDGPLVGGGLLTIEDPDRPYLTRALRVPDRVAAFLLGDDDPDASLSGLIAEPASVGELPGAGTIAEALSHDVGLCYLRNRTGTDSRSLAAAGLTEVALDGLHLDLTRVHDESVDLAVVVQAAVREARLRPGVLVAGPIDELAGQAPRALQVLADAEVHTILFGTVAWDPAWGRRVPLQVDPPEIAGPVRDEIWHQALEQVGIPELDTRPLSALHVGPQQAERAVASARWRASVEGREISHEDLRAGAREQNAGRLEHLARRVEPRAGFDDLVVPARTSDLLREIIDRARHRDRVLSEWGMGGQTERGRGVTALFAGESGTGKTLSAEVIAGALGLDLYTIDLSTVVDKYVGETEKNLERIFAEAEGVNGVLFFDEADALFGKRSDVSDARDRYANVEIAYLLQRMEYLDGIAILATNLRGNLDEAFTRRIDVLIDFPEPEETDRLLLWELHLPDGLPTEDDLDLDYLAKAFELAGGDIRNITLAAAYAAAVDAAPLSTEHLIRATAREYRKLGRLCTESEFGPYFDLIEPRTGGRP